MKWNILHCPACGYDDPPDHHIRIETSISGESTFYLWCRHHSDEMCIARISLDHIHTYINPWLIITFGNEPIDPLVKRWINYAKAWYIQKTDWLYHTINTAGWLCAYKIDQYLTKIGMHIQNVIIRIQHRWYQHPGDPLVIEWVDDPSMCPTFELQAEPWVVSPPSDSKAYETDEAYFYGASLVHHRSRSVLAAWRAMVPSSPET